MRHSRIPPGALPRLALMTFASIASSFAVTCVLTLCLFGWPGDGYFSSAAIWRCSMVCSLAAPGLISPFVIWRLMTLLHNLGLAQEALSRLATTDALTGLLNRRGFDALAAPAMSEALAARRPVSALACDIDRFKSINDRFGHDAGDLVIRRFGELLNETFASTGALISRHGGEEFVVLMPGAPAAYAAKWAEKLRAACAAEPDFAAGRAAPFTVSIGLADTAQAGASLRDLLRCADAALYEAKGRGRNRVARYSPPPLAASA